MITINTNAINYYYCKTTIKDLTGGNCKSNRDAFIGCVGESEEHQVFLVTYECIVLLKEPSKTWNGRDCEVHIEKFIDLDITITERK